MDIDIDMNIDMDMDMDMDMVLDLNMVVTMYMNTKIYYQSIELPTTGLNFFELSNYRILDNWTSK